MEATLWKATWKRNGRKFALSLVDHPTVKVIGAELRETVERLEDLIAETLGDPVPHLEFLEPLPEDDAVGTRSYIHILAGHRRVEPILNLDRLFAREQCKKCDNFSGPRTDELIQLDAVPDGDLTFTHCLGQIISKRLADFLELGKSTDMVTRPVILQGKQSMDFHELRSLRPRNYAAHKELKRARWGFKCRACGFVVWMYMPYEAKFLEFVCGSDLPEKSTRVFPIGVDDRMQLAVSTTTRAAVIRSNQFKNVVSKKVGVLTAEQALPISSCFHH